MLSSPYNKNHVSSYTSPTTFSTDENSLMQLSAIFFIFHSRSIFTIALFPQTHFLELLKNMSVKSVQWIFRNYASKDILNSFCKNFEKRPFQRSHFQMSQMYMAFKFRLNIRLMEVEKSKKCFMGYSSMRIWWSVF